MTSAGIRPRSEKLIGQPPGEIAESEGTPSVVAANLAMEEQQSQREGQYTNHGEHDKRVAASLMHRRFLEMAVGGDGLKHFGIDDPTAPT